MSSLNINIWDNQPASVIGRTPFGFYDGNSEFQSEGPKFAKWAANRLGYPIVEVELQDINFYAALEEATTVYSTEIYQYKVRENYLSIEGSTTGSNLNNVVMRPNFGKLIELAENYGTEAGSGGNVRIKSGSININADQQTYNLNTLWADVSESGAAIEIRRIYHQTPPAMTRYLDPLAGTGGTIQSLLEGFGFSGYSPSINFMMMPMSYDVQKLQAIEFNDMIRRSQYSFELLNNELRIFPIPSSATTIWFQYLLKSDRNAAYVSGSNGLVSNYSNVPFTTIDYNTINPLGKQWIWSYALALAKETLANVRGKYSTVPIPGGEITLNSSDLRTSSEKEKADLLEQLRLTLDQTSRTNQLNKKVEENTALSAIMTQIPLKIYVG